MSEQSGFTIGEIEAAIDDRLREQSVEAVTAAELIKRLGGRKSAALTDRIDRTLAGDDRFFDDGKGNFTPRAMFFRNYEFIITPDEWEIQQGILFPGHRFAACVNPEVFPSEVELLVPGGAAIAKTTVSAPVSQVFHYHLLLGSEQLFDFFTAESQANANLSRHPQPTDPVTLNVFDLAEFFGKNSFRPGDALYCRVLDWVNGKIEFAYLSGEERKDAAVKSWIAAYETALETVFDRFENYPEIPEQLAYACFFGAGTLPEAKDSASLDEFVRRTTRVEINFDADHTVLARRQTGETEEAAEPPDGFRVSRGETGEIGTLLREVGSPLSPVEVDSYILDCCYARELDFEQFFARAFGREKLKFADEGQQAVFYNYAEERFEELTETYNRYDDEPKAALRSTILELVDDRLAFFDFLASQEKTREALSHEDLKELAELSLQLDEILKMLNDPGYTPDAGDLDRLAETVELRADDSDALIARLTDQFGETTGGENS